MRKEPGCFALGAEVIEEPDHAPGHRGREDEASPPGRPRTERPQDSHPQQDQGERDEAAHGRGPRLPKVPGWPLGPDALAGPDPTGEQRASPGRDRHHRQGEDQGEPQPFHRHSPSAARRLCLTRPSSPPATTSATARNRS